MKDWSSKWKGSENPGKQRKYRENAPHHARKKFVSSRLSSRVRDKVGTKSLTLREGDRVKIVRGDRAGEEGNVRDIDRKNYKIYVEEVDRETVSGSEVHVPVDPSNVVVTRLNLDDEKRLEKFEVSEEDVEDIEVEESIEEEAEEEEGAEEEDAEEMEEEIDYEDLVKENISDIKERVEEENLDLEKVLEAEKENKERVTLIEWLENRIEEDGDE